jgi:hypothetical protein
MTTKEVLRSSWGYPNDVNTTETQNGTHEQWVYDHDYRGKDWMTHVEGYLYFENGVLTSMQY